MEERTEAILAGLYELVENAKSVPMSASCMVNRKETLQILEQAREAFKIDIGEAQRVTENSLATLERAQKEAEQIIKAAEDKATYLSNQTEVVSQATQRAEAIEMQAMAESDALKRETDTYIDQRIASFEAALQNTINQIQTMRSRLADRSQIGITDTQALPEWLG
ncbi:MAG: hypothetical protein FWG47_02905 [Propionibacteriaceae bacterium]|nr:hypothetical protein [Propionibacteriaceae bacterium]